MSKKRKQNDFARLTPEAIVSEPFQLNSLQKHELQLICDRFGLKYLADDTIKILLQLIYVHAKQQHQDQTHPQDQLTNPSEPKNIDTLPVFPVDMHLARQDFEKSSKVDGHIRSGIITAYYAAKVLDHDAKMVFVEEQNKIRGEFEARCQKVASKPFFQKIKSIEKEFTAEEIQKLRPEKFDFDSWYIVDWLTKSATISNLNPNPLELNHLEVWWDINLLGSLIDACFLDCYRLLDLHRREKRPRASSKLTKERHGLDGIFEIKDGIEIGVIESALPQDTFHIEQDQLKIAKRLKDFLDHAFTSFGTSALRVPFIGIQTAGTSIEIFQLVRSFSNAYIFVSLSKLAIPMVAQLDVESVTAAVKQMLALKYWMLEFCPFPFKTIPQPTADSSLAIPAPIHTVETAPTPVKQEKKRVVTNEMAKNLTYSFEERHDNSILWHATTKEGDHVVIKRTNKEMGMAELRGLTEIQSNYVVEPLGFWTANNLYHIILPRLQPIEWNNPSDTEVKIVIFQLLLALRDIHAAGLVHLDISCNNIMRDPQTHRINVIDFGLSRPVSDSDPYPSVGTEAFMSPEMVEGEAVGTATDVFAAGIVFAVLLSNNDSWRHARVLRECNWGKFLLNTQSLFAIQNRLSEISHNAIQLLLAMLEPYPEDRITVSAALKHPYFSQEISNVEQ